MSASRATRAPCSRASRPRSAAKQIKHDDWLAKLRDGETKIVELRQKWLHSDSDPIHPLRLCNEIAKFVDEDTIVVGDGGDIVGLASQVLPVNRPSQFMGPGPLGTLGVGTGFCMAASVVYPDKRVLMVNGDGSFGLNGFDFDTFVRFNMPVVSVIGNDRQWGQILVGQAKMYGDERVVATRLGDNARYDKVVEALGGHGEFVTEPGRHRAGDRARVRLRQARLRERDHRPEARRRHRRLRVHGIAASRYISSTGTSLMCVASHHRMPNASRTPALRSPYRWSAGSPSDVAPAASAALYTASTSSM